MAKDGLREMRVSCPIMDTVGETGVRTKQVVKVPVEPGWPS
jgi:hypothetical protein